MSSLSPRKNKVQRNQVREGFVCMVCGRSVPAEGGGTHHRNHCPHCLSSLHLDDVPGDRASGCGGVMEPAAIWVRKNGEWALIHRCTVCGVLHSNRVAADDNPAKLLALDARPLAEPPFPLKRLEEMLKESEKNE